MRIVTENLFSRERRTPNLPIQVGDLLIPLNSLNELPTVRCWISIWIGDIFERFMTIKNQLLQKH